MLRLALAGHTRFSVDPQEVERGGISYSVETVRVFARRYPEARLYYLIGADHLPQLPRWREAASLAELVEFIVISRPGEANLSAPEPFRTVALNGFPLALSASQIRFRVQAGLPLSGLLPDAVAEAIRNNRLYL
jgi:nicotinate-nucleotide adenylyltransferase